MRLTINAIYRLITKIKRAFEVNDEISSFYIENQNKLKNGIVT